MPIEPDLKKRHQGKKYARFEGVGQGWGRRICILCTLCAFGIQFPLAF